MDQLHSSASFVYQTDPSAAERFHGSHAGTDILHSRWRVVN
jgi:hypothetical protein